MTSDEARRKVPLCDGLGRSARMNSFVDNGWVISLVSILIAFAVTPFLQKAVDWIQARRGELTGTYLALSQDDGPSTLVVEIIQCQHMGPRLKGKIITWAVASLGTVGTSVNIDDSSRGATYSFDGRLQARQALLSYWDDAKASQFGGTLTIGLDASGSVFRGIWSGTAANGQIVSGPCVWIINIRPDIHDMDSDQLGKYIQNLIGEIENPWKKDPPKEEALSKLP
jgi:hypothetical protein